MLVLAAAAVAGAVNTDTASAKVAVPQGISAVAGKADDVFGPTDPNTPEIVSFILQGQHLNQLQNQVERGMNGHFLSVADFAQAYGQSGRNIKALQDYLAKYKIATTVYPNGLVVAASGTAGEFDAALSVKQKDYQAPAQPARDGHPGAP